MILRWGQGEGEKGGEKGEGEGRGGEGRGGRERGGGHCMHIISTMILAASVSDVGNSWV
jgi:hypothetical protein